MNLKRDKQMEDKKVMKLTIRLLFVVSVLLGAGIYFVGYFLEPQNSLPDPVVISKEQTMEEEGVVTLQENEVETPVTPIVQEVDISAAGAYEILTGDTLYEFRAEKRWPIASITKLVTAMVAMEVFDATETIEIDEKALAIVGESGGFELGDVYTVEDLIKSMMLVSSNDAAHALAMHFGEDEFIEEMNALVEEIGMENTTFHDPSGLSPQNLSTVEDLEILAEYVFENYKSVLAISRMRSGTIREVNTGVVRSLVNINAFAGRPDFLGGKTGHIPDSGGNLLSIFEDPKTRDPIVIIVFGAGDRFYQTEKILDNL